MSRVISGELLWAKRSQRPVGLPIGRSRGAKAAGLRYERSLAAALPRADHGAWWRFADSSGLRCCQTDFVLVGKSLAFVLEAKYTYTHEAWKQLNGLYIPVLRSALAPLPVFGVQVCKNLTGEEIGQICTNLSEALALAKAGEAYAVLHWTGTTSLWSNSPGALPPQENSKCTSPHPG